jgi:hypothetical protein
MIYDETHVLNIDVYSSGRLFQANEILNLNLSLQRPGQLCSLFPIPVCLSPGQSLFPGLSWHSGSTGTGSNGKALVGEPGFEDATYDIERSRLDDTAPDRFATSHTDVDDTLKGEGKSVGGVFVERVGIQSWGKAGWACARRGQSIEEGRVLWGRGAHTKVVEDADESFETAVHGHYFADSGGGGG